MRKDTEVLLTGGGESPIQEMMEALYEHVSERGMDEEGDIPFTDRKGATEWPNLEKSLPDRK